jgi:hypothetical protein
MALPFLWPNPNDILSVGFEAYMEAVARLGELARQEIAK